MADFEVPNPILNSPFDEPGEYWQIEEGKPPLRHTRAATGRLLLPEPERPDAGEHAARGEWRELAAVNLIRSRMAEWRALGDRGSPARPPS